MLHVRGCVWVSHVGRDARESVLSRAPTLHPSIPRLGHIQIGQAPCGLRDPIGRGARPGAARHAEHARRSSRRVCCNTQISNAGKRNQAPNNGRTSAKDPRRTAQGGFEIRYAMRSDVLLHPSHIRSTPTPSVTANTTLVFCCMHAKKAPAPLLEFQTCLGVPWKTRLRVESVEAAEVFEARSFLPRLVAPFGRQRPHMRHRTCQRTCVIGCVARPSALPLLVKLEACCPVYHHRRLRAAPRHFCKRNGYVSTHTHPRIGDGGETR